MNKLSATRLMLARCCARDVHRGELGLVANKVLYRRARVCVHRTYVDIIRVRASANTLGTEIGRTKFGDGKAPRPFLFATTTTTLQPPPTRHYGAQTIPK